MLANWLLIIAVATNSSTGGRGVTATLVTEAQCRGALKALNPSGREIVCISPDGTVVTREAR